MNWTQRLNNAVVKAQRALANSGVDPVSGYELDDIKFFIEDCPIGREADSRAALNRIRAMEAKV